MWNITLRLTCISMLSYIKQRFQPLYSILRRLLAISHIPRLRWQLNPLPVLTAGVPSKPGHFWIVPHASLRHCQSTDNQSISQRSHDVLDLPLSNTFLHEEEQIDDVRWCEAKPGRVLDRGTGVNQPTWSSHITGLPSRLFPGQAVFLLTEWPRYN